MLRYNSSMKPMDQDWEKCREDVASWRYDHQLSKKDLGEGRHKTKLNIQTFTA